MLPQGARFAAGMGEPHSIEALSSKLSAGMFVLGEDHGGRTLMWEVVDDGTWRRT